MRIRYISLLFAAVMGLGGCQLGNLTATNIQKPLTSTTTNERSATFVDAQQRAIVSGYNVSAPTQVITCLEPSPDVFSAIAARAGLSVSGLSDALAADGGISETAASIGLRTQTITLLRDSNVQPCLARMNGSDQVQYDMMMRRSQNNIAGLLAIEQLTGAVRGPNAVAGAVAGAGGNAKAAFTALGEQQKSLQESLKAKVTETTAKKKVLDDEKKGCAATPPAKDVDCTDAAKTKRDADIAKFESDLTILNGKIEEAKRLESQYGATAAASAAAEQGGLLGLTVTPALAATDTAAVAEVVENITLNMINRDYTLQMCFDYGRAGQLDVRPVATADTPADLARKATGDFCRRVMTAAATQHETQSNLSKAWSDKLPGILASVLQDGIIDDKERALIDAILKNAGQSASPGSASVSMIPGGGVLTPQ